MSRAHSIIAVEGGKYFLEDCGSRHGTLINGKKVKRHLLTNSDRIEFGVPDSYSLVFALDGVELKRMMEQVWPPGKASWLPHGVGCANLGKLRAILDLARTLQHSFSVDDVLAQVVDTALAITGAERGFLLLRKGDGLETRVARNNRGRKLAESDLRVPREVIHRALQQRRELLSMNFDPLGHNETRPQNSVADLELRSVVCVPIVRIRTGHGEATVALAASSETAGVLYMDSRISAADLAGGNRELLQTLAIEASTVLENARLLEEERGKRLMEEELTMARTIQQSLLPRLLPSDGWMRACGSSLASREVGGDYFDVTEVNAQCRSAVVADVSGKGVSSALLASLLQGALITSNESPGAMGVRIERLNRFLLERTGGGKYATVFYCLLDHGGKFNYVNAAHCPPIVVRADGTQTELECVTGMPVGLGGNRGIRVWPSGSGEAWREGGRLQRRRNGSPECDGDFFGKKRLREAIAA